MIDWTKKIALAVFLAAVFGTFAYMSVYGLRSFLANQPVVAVVFGSGLEASKLAIVIGTHRQWPTLGILSRIGRSAVVIALIATTSAGVLGFMWLSHNVSTGGFQKLEARREALETEASAIRADLDALEKTISAWPETWVTKRLEARENAKYYKKQDRLREILQSLEGLAVKKTIEYSGPVFATASVIKWTPGKIAKRYVLWLVLLGEAAGFWLMILNSRAWRKEETGDRGTGDGKKDTATQFVEAFIPPAKMPDKDGKDAGQNADTAKMPANMPNKTAKMPAKMPGGNGQNAGSAEMPANMPSGPNGVLIAIVKENGLSPEDIARITGRSKIGTVMQWLRDEAVIPEKALRMLRREVGYGNV